MANENLDTTNKLIKPEDISPSDDEIIRALSDNLQDITPKDIDAICDKMEEMEKRKEDEKKKGEIPKDIQSIADEQIETHGRKIDVIETKNNYIKMGKIPPELTIYRKTWEKEISGIRDETKEKIIKSVDKIPIINVEQDSDGGRVIEFILNGKKYKILDPILKNHSDDEYMYNPDYGNIDCAMLLQGMMGDDVERWKNKKLKEYVQERQKTGLHIPTELEMKGLLGELGKQIKSNNLSDQIASLMYLTGMMNLWYRCSMKDSISRSRLVCGHVSRCYSCRRNDLGIGRGSLLMISCE